MSTMKRNEKTERRRRSMKNRAGPRVGAHSPHGERETAKSENLSSSLDFLPATRAEGPSSVRSHRQPLRWEFMSKGDAEHGGKSQSTESNPFESCGKLSRTSSRDLHPVFKTASEGSKRLEPLRGVQVPADTRPSIVFRKRPMREKTKKLTKASTVVNRGAQTTDSSREPLHSEALREQPGRLGELKTTATNTQQQPSRLYVDGMAGSLAKKRTPSASTRSEECSTANTSSATHCSLQQLHSVMLSESPHDVNSRTGRTCGGDLVAGVMFVSALCLILAILMYLLVSFRISGEPLKAEKFSACMSDGCLRDAAFLNNLLSWNVVWPCDNFYMFVCRKWKNQFVDTPLVGSISVDDDYVANAEQKMYEMLQDRLHGSRVIQPLRTLLDKCMDVKQIEKVGWDPLLELMREASVGTFPLTPPTRSSLSVWKAAGHVLRKTGAAALLSLGIGANRRDGNKDIVLIAPPDMLTSSTNIDVKEAVRLYTDAVFSAFKALRKEFVPAGHTLGIVKFAGSLEALCDSRSREVQSYEIAKLNTSSHLYVFLTEALRGSEETFRVRPGVDVLLQSHAIIAKVVELVESTELHVVLNYISLRLMIQTSPFIPPTDLTDFYGVLLYGKIQNSLPRWKLCLRVIEKALFPLAYISFLTSLNVNASALKLSVVVSEAARAFLRGVKVSPLFNAFSRAAIHKTFVKTRLKVLAPSWISDNALLEAYLLSLPTITPADTPLISYVATFEHSFAHSMSRNYSQQWRRSAFSTDCDYDAGVRAVHVPLLVFNVTPGWDYAQVPRVAFRVGKCILDMLFAEANSTADLEPWLDRETRLRFEEAERCFGGSPPGPLRARWFPKLTDALAVKFALNAFQGAVTTSGKVLGLRLPSGKLLTHDELFFIFLVLQACERNGDRSLPAEAGARWNVVFRKHPDFQAALNCPFGSEMNQAGHCDV